MRTISSCPTAFLPRRSSGHGDNPPGWKSQAITPGVAGDCALVGSRRSGPIEIWPEGRSSSKDRRKEVSPTKQEQGPQRKTEPTSDHGDRCVQNEASGRPQEPK
jgi:hypothetical protein